MRNAMHKDRPLVGVGVLLLDENARALLGKRKGPLGEGTYGFPGGHLEYAESLSGCAKREVLEETGMALVKLNFLCITNMIVDGHHYVDIVFVTRCNAQSYYPGGGAEKIEWSWYPLEELPEPMFAPAETSIQTYLSGERIIDLIFE